MIEEYYRDIFHDPLFYLLIEFQASFDIPLTTCFFEQRIYFRIAVSGVILLAAGMEEDVGEVLRIWVVGAPTDGEDLFVVSLVELLNEGL